MFFSRCALRCIYCQNYPWSQLGEGEDYDGADLIEVFRHLRHNGCHNWNWVSPTPWLPSLLEALDGIADAGEELLPVVYNTSGYERVETIKALDGRVAVYLADLRYADNAVANEASGVSNYVETARAALEEMHRQTGTLREQNGIAVSGLIVRILVLPGHHDDACANLRWIAERLGSDTAVSVMAQYMPAFRAREAPPWDRTITSIEYEKVCATLKDCGFYTGWIQEMNASAPGGLIGFEMAARNKAGIAEHNGRET